MQRSSLSRAFRTALAAGAVALLGAASPASAVMVYGLDVDNNLFSFDSAAPNDIVTANFVSGLAQNEGLVGIDFRPATGELLALGSLNNLYTLNTTTGAATLIGAGIGIPLSGTAYGFDVNPVVDRVRATSDTDQNLRLNPNTGLLVQADGTLAYAPGDPNFGRNPSVVGSAYTNNFAGTTSTTLYGIDSVNDVLVTQVPPNSGTLNTVGALGVNATNLTGFDIFGATTAFAALQTGYSGVSEFYTIDLTSGEASLVGEIGGGLWVRDIAVVAVPEPSTALLMALGMAGLAGMGSRKRG